MIPQGTLCLLVAPHSRAGRVCVVSGPLARYVCRHVASATMQVCDVYDVTIPDDPGRWCAEPAELIVICPPPQSPPTATTDREPSETREA
jgi:hypothetical protein